VIADTQQRWTVRRPVSVLGRALILAALLGHDTPSATAQVPASPPSRLADSGAVLRFHLAVGRTQAGRLLAPLDTGIPLVEYCRFPAPPCRPGDSRHVRRVLTDILTIDKYGGTRARTGALVGGGAGVALGIGAILASRNSEEPRVGPIYAAFSVVLLTGLGALIGVAMPVWQPVRAP
jgi:hypothetical protein